MASKILRYSSRRIRFPVNKREWYTKRSVRSVGSDGSDGLKVKKDEDKDKIYEKLTENFDKAVKLAEERIESISGGVFEWFGNRWFF